MCRLYLKHKKKILTKRLYLIHLIKTYKNSIIRYSVQLQIKKNKQTF